MNNLNISYKNSDDRYHIRYFYFNQNLFWGTLLITSIIVIQGFRSFFINKTATLIIFIPFILIILRFWYYSFLHCRIVIDPENMTYVKGLVFCRKIGRKHIQMADIYEKDINKTKFSKGFSLFVLRVYVNGKKYNMLITKEKKDCYTVMELVNNKIKTK